MNNGVDPAIVEEKLAKGEVKPADVEAYSVTKADLWTERIELRNIKIE